MQAAPYVYIRGLRQVDHSVFCVQDGQKTYWDPVFNRRVPFSSGQQVKRSVLDGLSDRLNQPRAPITFNYAMKDTKDAKELEQKEPWSPCNPTYADQLIGGWMRAASGETPLKRRSPLSISAMRPLHALLSGIDRENLTFDRSDNPDNNPVIVRNAKGETLEEDAIQEFLDDNHRTLPRRHWIPNNTRATGLFIYDIAIDLRRLFSVAKNQHDPEVPKETLEALQGDGWTDSKDGLYVVCPPERRTRILSALPAAILNWRITSNQARTYSPMETLAIAISDNANRIGSAIRADLLEDVERPAAAPVIESVKGVDVFVMPACRAVIAGVDADPDALDNAEAKLKECLEAVDYEAFTMPVAP